MVRPRKPTDERSLRGRFSRARADLTTTRRNSETLIGLAQDLGGAVADFQSELRELRAELDRRDEADQPVAAPADGVLVHRSHHRKGNVVVSSNCATGGLAGSLVGMLPDHNVIPVPWLGEMTPVLDEVLADASVWVTSTPGPSIEAILRESGNPSLQVVKIPTLVFEAFHPDLTYIPDPAGDWVKSPADGWNSAIVFWGWKHGLDGEQIMARFSAETCAALGYHQRWGQAVEGMRAQFVVSDLSFDSFLLRVRRHGPFMLGSNHPRIDALIEMARQVAAILGGPEELRRFAWESVLPDALLAAGPVWPVYPVVADALSVPGGFVWRCPGGALLDLEQFVVDSLRGYESYDPDEIKLPLFDHPVFDEVLSVEPASRR
jgi:hypothetical protein